MKIKYDLRKSVNENAAVYFEKSKKLKKKLEGIETTIDKYEKEKKDLLKKKAVFEAEQESESRLKQRKKEWFEKFRWFYTSKGHLAIGGRDSSTNEVIIKKHTENGDLVFHTDQAGSPFFVLKSENPTEEEIEEVASATASFSRAWKNGLSSTDVFYVTPDQVTKEANAGESLAKGAFVIKGKTTYVKNKVELAVEVDTDGRVQVAPPSSLGNKAIKIIQGNEKTSDIAKKLIKMLKNGLLDDFVRSLPSGGCKIKK